MEDAVTSRSAAVIADAIREEILLDNFEQGMPLREVSLAAHYSVSRRTIRESLLSLAADGLVSHRHNQGASVRTFDADDIQDLYRVRRVLETEGARAATFASDEALARVEAAYAELAQAEEDGFESVELAHADVWFHGAVIALFGSPGFDAFYRSIAQQLIRVTVLLQRSDLAQKRFPASVGAEHRAIRNAVMHRDAWEARYLIEAHIDRHVKNLLNGLGLA